MTDETWNELIRIKNLKEKAYRDKRDEIDTFKNSLRTMENTFQSNWLKIRRKVLTKVSAEIENSPAKELNDSEEDPLNTEKLTKKDQAII